jgi:hypothetical protein
VFSVCTPFCALYASAGRDVDAAAAEGYGDGGSEDDAGSAASGARGGRGDMFCIAAHFYSTFSMTVSGSDS